MTDGDKQLIRNSSAELLTFTGPAGEQSIEACYKNDTARGSKEREWK